MLGVSHGTVRCSSHGSTHWLMFSGDFHLLPQHIVKHNLAPCYKDWPSIVILMDCTEVFIKAPSDLQTNKEVFSNYKQHDPDKFLVGTSPNMTIFFILQGWSGCASDKTITLSSEDLMQWLAPDDTVMGDKGFLVGSDFAARNIKVVMPSFKGSDHSQFTSMEIESFEKSIER